MNWDQLRTMLWLRWRLTRNQWSRGGQLNAVITLIAVGFALCLAVVGGIAGVVGGALALAKVPPLMMMVAWDTLVALFLLVWCIGLIAELQRSELIDLSRFLHLPVSLRDVFLLNYAASHLSLSLALLLPTMLGLTVGLVLRRSLLMVLLVPLLLGFFFMITAWTYCLREWLASLMVNPRRRRAIIMGLTVTIVLLGQLPNLLVNVWQGRTQGGRGGSKSLEQPAARQQIVHAVTIAHEVVPFLWLPHGARGLAEGRVWPALWGAAGALALGALGLRRAFVTTLRFYQGGAVNQPAKPSFAQKPVGARRSILVERKLPVIPDEASALALTNFRSMARAPEVKMALFVNVLVMAIMAAGIFARGIGTLPDAARPFVASGAVLVTFLGLIQVLCNQFGFDRDGFRALVLLPARRPLLLLGKNLSLLPPALIVFLVFLGLVTVLAHLPVWAILAACLQFSAAFLGLSLLGNFVSILAPYRIAAGSLKPTKMKATNMLVIVFIQMLFPLAAIPIMAPAGLGLLCEYFGWLPAGRVTLLCSALLVVLTGLLYWQTLAPLGALLQRREMRILNVVTQEVE